MFSLPSHLWPPQRRGLEKTINALNQGRHTCLYAPTGGGKTEVAVQLFRLAMSRNWRGCFYVNRRLLIAQTVDRFEQAKLPFGVRAAGYEDYHDFSAPCQICSADTERARVLRSNRWELFRSDLVIVDEAHIQKASTMQALLARHKNKGARVVLMTATPIGLSHLANNLVVSGTLEEYRQCRALVKAQFYSIEQPDLRKVKRNKVGEFILDGRRRSIYAQTIVGHVIDAWRRYNPDARPALLYAPGKAESVWFTEQFENAGVPWCHLDANDAVLDGKRTRLTRRVWEEILDRFKQGNIKGLSSRFKLREGIDVPEVYHCILATPIGSPASYLQTVGRCLRYSASTPDGVVVTDHGGNFWRHGSPNADRDWADWWDLPESAIAKLHEARVREGEANESIVCPKCRAEWETGRFHCPVCGFEFKKSVRRVIQTSGKIRLCEGRLVYPRHPKKLPNTQALWDRLFWSARKWKKDRTYEQNYAWFYQQHGYWPPRDLDHMPRSLTDWRRKVSDVPFGRLTGVER